LKLSFARRSATACPIPDAPPVTMATLPMRTSYLITMTVPYPKRQTSVKLAVIKF
jgi:hypothetical protein